MYRKIGKRTKLKKTA